MRPFGYQVRITSLQEKYTSGTIEPGGYSFWALIFDKPSVHGIEQGRISKLWIRDKQGEPVIEYDRAFPLDSGGRPVRHTGTQKQLIRAMLRTFPGTLEKGAQREEAGQSAAQRRGEQIEAEKARAPSRDQERLGLDKHKLVPIPERPPKETPAAPAKPPQPHDRVRFEGFSCLVPPGCPDLETFTDITRQMAQKHFGSEAEATKALRAYEECLDTKGQFRGYPEAVQRYLEARILASPEAQAWKDFAQDHDAAFDDYDEEGKDVVPPIPGWSATNVTFQSAAHERGEQVKEEKARAVPRDQERERD